MPDERPTIADGHLVLLGDSIFDNARYVPGEPAVIDHLRRTLPRGWRATLLAVDGSCADDVGRQLARLPADATHLVVSVGGNDALGRSDLIRNGQSHSVADALSQMDVMRESFGADYAAMLAAVTARGLPVTVCTIYDAVPGLAAAERTALCLFNDVILRAAFASAAAVVDLRAVCTAGSDYARWSPIEPSAAGGSKIARAVLVAVAGPAVGGCRVFA